MKKFLGFIAIIVLCIVGFFFFSKGSTQSVLPSTTTPSAAVTSYPEAQTTAPAVTRTVSNSEPQTLSIPAINVSAPIESVGMDQKGNMDVPKDADNVAWYNLGYKIGDNGSAVLAGHYDRVTGAPAVFYELSSLSPGDEITVTMEDGTTYTYRVTRSASYNHDALPLEEIFNTPGKPTLNLITCEGVFNANTNLYSKRLVVYSELVE